MYNLLEAFNELDKINEENICPECGKPSKDCTCCDDEKRDFDFSEELIKEFFEEDDAESLTEADEDDMPPADIELADIESELSDDAADATATDAVDDHFTKEDVVAVAGDVVDTVKEVVEPDKKLEKKIDKAVDDKISEIFPEDDEAAEDGENAKDDDGAEDSEADEKDDEAGEVKESLKEDAEKDKTEVYNNSLIKALKSAGYKDIGTEDDPVLTKIIDGIEAFIDREDEDGNSSDEFTAVIALDSLIDEYASSEASIDKICTLFKKALKAAQEDLEKAKKSLKESD